MADFEEYPITPISPHSDTLIMTAFNSAYYRMFRMLAFDPSAIGDLTKFKAIMRAAVEIGKPAATLKELTAGEQAAFEAYIPVLMAQISQFATNALMHDEIPIVVTQQTAATHDLLTLDDFDTIKTEFDNSHILSIPGLEDFVTNIVTTGIEIETPDAIREFPGSVLYLFVPFNTITEMRADLTTMLTNSHLFASYCKKMGVPTVTWNSAKICSKRAPLLKKHNWDNKSFQFWAFQAWCEVNDVAGETHIVCTQYDQAAAIYSAADFLTYYQYVYKKDDKPNSLNNVVRMMYPYHANNLIGCTVLMSGAALNINGIAAFANADLNVIAVAVNSYTPDWLTITSDEVMLVGNCFPGVFSDNATLGFDKTVDSDPNLQNSREIYMLPADFKIKTFGGTTGPWDNTNFNLEIVFFQKLIRNEGGKKKGFTPKGKDTHPLEGVEVQLYNARASK